MNVTSTMANYSAARTCGNTTKGGGRTCGNTTKGESAPQGQVDGYTPSGDCAESKPAIGLTEVQSVGGAILCGAVGYLTHGPQGAAIGAILGLVFL